jgi:hypothetical protein
VPARITIGLVSEIGALATRGRERIGIGWRRAMPGRLAFCSRLSAHVTALS